MNFFTAETMRRLFAPRHELSCSWWTWRRLLARLRERGRRRSRESGAFLLGRRSDGRARVVDFVLYDDLDPHCLDTGIVRFDGRHFGALWDLCKVRGLTVVADATIVASFVIFFYVMKQNSFAAATVRVERGQTVISTGLYGVVRHPMYMGTLPLTIAMPLALGSWWALLPVLAIVPALVWRLVDEERVLRRDLPGYAAYCARVRYRLVPGIW